MSKQAAPQAAIGAGTPETRRRRGVIIMDYAALRSLPDMFFQQADRLGDRPFLWAKRGDEWRPMRWAEAAEQVRALARGLRGLGIQPGDRVALVSENRPEWLIADIAVMAAGGITVPGYTTNTTEDHRYILADSGAKLAIVSTAALARNLLPGAAQTPEAATVVTMEPIPGKAPQGTRILGWDELLDQGRALTEDAPKQQAERGDTACIIYTSGTSGRPKGVMLSHGAIICNCFGAYQFLKDLPDFEKHPEVFLSFLPLSHSYEHTAGQFFPISIGAEIYYAESVDKLTANIAEVRPTILTAVPRLYEVMHARIMRGVEKAGGLKQRMFLKAVALGRRRYEAPDSLGFRERMLDRTMERLVRDKVRARFGGRLKAFVSGGAPLNYDIGVFFQALGLRILQGYGQTESAPVVSCNPPGRNKLRTVGRPLAGVQVCIAEDGEILVRGELVMQGYWHDPEATARTIVDGWLHTGDIGEIDAEGYIRITDRKKDIIVNSGGDNIAPQRVEGMLTVEPEIGQALVYGDRRPHLVALIVPDMEFANSWARAQGKPADLPELAADPEFQKAIREAVDRVNGSLSAIERVRRFLIAEEPFSIENGMMTPTLKIRRHVIKQRYGAALDDLYG